MAKQTVYQRCFTPCGEHITKAPGEYPGDCKTCNSRTGDAMRVYAQTQANKRQSYTFSSAKLKWWYQGHNDPNWPQRLSLWTSAVAGWGLGTIPAITKEDLRDSLESARHWLGVYSRSGMPNRWWAERVRKLEAQLAA